MNYCTCFLFFLMFSLVHAWWGPDLHLRCLNLFGHLRPLEQRLAFVFDEIL